MLGRMGKDDEEQSLPSWLKEDGKKDKSNVKSPKKRFLKGRMSKNSSYGSTTQSAVQEDYGEVPMPPDSPPPPPSGDIENNKPDWANSDREEAEEEESSSEEEDDDDEESSEDSSEEESDEEDESDEDESSEESETDRLVAPEHEWSKDKKSRKKSRKFNGDGNATNKRPIRNCCHSFFILVQLITILGNLAMILVEIVPIFAWKKMLLEQKVVRCYLAFFNFVLILTEVELHSGLNNWIIRGVVYTFLGTLSLDQKVSMVKYGFLNPKTATSVGQTWTELWTNLFITVTSWWMIGIGCMYFLLGAFCMKGWRDHFRTQYQQKLKKYEEKMKRKEK